MIELTLREIAEIIGGTLGHADPSVRVTGSVEFDSRAMTPGGLFVAFDGEHVDGHDHVGPAFERGAVASVVTRPVAGPSIVVDDAWPPSPPSPPRRTAAARHERDRRDRIVGQDLDQGPHRAGAGR